MAGRGKGKGEGFKLTLFHAPKDRGVSGFAQRAGRFVGRRAKNK